MQGSFREKDKPQLHITAGMWWFASLPKPLRALYTRQHFRRNSHEEIKCQMYKNLI